MSGTGAFLKKLSEKLAPDTELHGFDRLGDAFPASSPANVHLHVHDCFRPFPSWWHNAFDAVHIRLMLGEMQSLSDWILLARNALQLLKPGGKLQWCECNMRQTRQVLREAQGTKIDATSRVCQLAWGAAVLVTGSRVGLFNSEGDWDLVEVLKGIGMDIVVQDIAASDRIPALRKYTSWEAIDAG
ncbi:MAG: hypothetical protein M1831_005760 [Alyxoria varia]|nr:MAG: hypothetical protein M1831_005760 [Alyxoria varia]